MSKDTLSNLYDYLSISSEIELRKTYDKLNLQQFKDLISQVQYLSKSIDESNLIAIYDKDENYMYVNDLYCKVSKYTREELIGKNKSIMKSFEHSNKFYDNLQKTIQGGYVWKGDIKHRAKDGSTFWVRASIVPNFDVHSKIINFVAISTVVDEIYESREKLSYQYDELKKIEKQKDEFSAMVAHELKTPLVPIQGYTDLVLNGQFGKINDDQKRVLSTALSSIKHLNELVNDILVLNKLELGRLDLHKKDININEFLEQVYDIALPYTHEKNITLEFYAEKHWTAYFDPSRIIQVILNLIKNSVDFVPKDSGKITISAKLGEENVTIISVTDNGPGITKGEEEKLFQKFYQYDTSLSREHGGTGIGLTICKGLVESHGGLIWADKELESGSSIKFSIPPKIDNQNLKVTSKIS